MPSPRRFSAAVTIVTILLCVAASARGAALPTTCAATCYAVERARWLATRSPVAPPMAPACERAVTLTVRFDAARGVSGLEGGELPVATDIPVLLTMPTHALEDDFAAPPTPPAAAAAAAAAAQAATVTLAGISWRTELHALPPESAVRCGLTLVQHRAAAWHALVTPAVALVATPTAMCFVPSDPYRAPPGADADTAACLAALAAAAPTLDGPPAAAPTSLRAWLSAPSPPACVDVGWAPRDGVDALVDAWRGESVARTTAAAVRATLLRGTGTLRFYLALVPAGAWACASPSRRLAHASSCVPLADERDLPPPPQTCAWLRAYASGAVVAATHAALGARLPTTDVVLAGATILVAPWWAAARAALHVLALAFPRRDASAHAARGVGSVPALLLLASHRAVCPGPLEDVGAVLAAVMLTFTLRARAVGSPAAGLRTVDYFATTAALATHVVAPALHSLIPAYVFAYETASLLMWVLVPVAASWWCAATHPFTPPLPPRPNDGKAARPPAW